jgi:hypothetical protein
MIKIGVGLLQLKKRIPPKWSIKNTKLKAQI